MKILAVVVTYYPDAADLVKNILQYIDHVEKLIVWENTPSEDRSKYHVAVPGHEAKIMYMSSGKNEGIALALNQAAAYGLQHGYTHLLTMDQDSCWENIPVYIKCIKECRIEKVLAFTPSMHIYRYKMREEPYEVKSCITSGAVYPFVTVKQIGKFREDFEIDAVDLEYCFRGRRNGFKTILISQGRLNHKLGMSINVMNKWQSPGYGPYRNFHIVRNLIWTWREYPEYADREFVADLYSRTIKRIVLIILGENNKCSKVLSILRGALAGLFTKPKIIEMFN